MESHYSKHESDVVIELIKNLVSSEICFKEQPTICIWLVNDKARSQQFQIARYFSIAKMPLQNILRPMTSLCNFLL